MTKSPRPTAAEATGQEQPQRRHATGKVGLANREPGPGGPGMKPITTSSFSRRPIPQRSRVSQGTQSPSRKAWCALQDAQAAHGLAGMCSRICSWVPRGQDRSWPPRREEREQAQCREHIQRGMALQATTNSVHFLAELRQAGSRAGRGWASGPHSEQAQKEKEAPCPATWGTEVS